MEPNWKHQRSHQRCFLVFWSLFSLLACCRPHGLHSITGERFHFLLVQLLTPPPPSPSMLGDGTKLLLLSLMLVHFLKSAVWFEWVIDDIERGGTIVIDTGEAGVWTGSRHRGPTPSRHFPFWPLFFTVRGSRSAAAILILGVSLYSFTLNLNDLKLD